MGLFVCVHMLLFWPIFAADLPFGITPKVRNKNRSSDNKRALILTVVVLFPKSTYKLLYATVTFDQGVTAKKHHHRWIRRAPLSQKQLSLANRRWVAEWQISDLIGCKARTSSPVGTSESFKL